MEVMTVEMIIVSKREHIQEYNEIRNDIKEMLVFMRERFDSIDKRFTSLQWFMGMGFVVLSVLITLMQYQN
jgi:hypothetical protein